MRGRSDLDGFCRACFVHLYPHDVRSTRQRCLSQERRWIVRLLQDPEIAIDESTQEPRNWTQNRCLFTSLPGA